MDRYQRVEKPKEETPINENEIRITTQGRMHNYITYATSLLQGSEKGIQSSLRYDGDSKSLRIHAKERIPLASNTLLQVHGELDTKTGSPSYFSLMFRYFYPESSASMGMGVQLNKEEELSYSIRAKRAFPLTDNGLVGINLKGRCNFEDGFKERKARGAIELAWDILNFQKEQDVRIKFGYDISNQAPYFQIRENNWTLNADVHGKWNVRFDL